MIKYFYLRFGLLFIAFALSVLQCAYSQNDSVQVKQNVEPVLTQEMVDTVYVIPYKPKKEKVKKDAEPQYIMPDTSLIDFALMRTQLKNYLFPTIETGVEYPDTVILPSISLPFVYFEDRVPITVNMPQIAFNQSFIPYEKRFAKVKIFNDKYNQNAIDRAAYLYVLDNCPQCVEYEISDFNGIIVAKVEEIAKDDNELKDIFKIEYDLNQTKIDQVERFSPKKRNWLWSGKHYFSLTQADNSTNWSDTAKTWGEKGLGAMNLVSVQTVTGKYKKDKIEINQNFEWRLNIANSMNDTLRSIKIVEDRLRSYTDFGVTAFKSWNYSSFLEITTPLLTTFRENKMDTLQSFLSPWKVSFGIGMKYKLDKTFANIRGKKLSFQADISPLSIQNIFIKDYVVNPAQHGIKIDGDKIKENKKGLNMFDFGSTINSTLAVNFNKWVSLSSRLKYFTDYSKSYCEFENTLNMPINRFLSTRLYFYLIFDDSRLKNQKFGYFDIKETVGLTFNFQW
jgi:hypothetical protein